MDQEIYSFNIFISSVTVNLLSYFLLLLTAILLSNEYIVQLARRHPFKAENDHTAISGFIQAIIASFPSLIVNTLHFSSESRSVLCASYRSVLLATALPLVILSLKASPKISLMGPSTIVLGLLTLISLASCFSLTLPLIPGVIFIICLIIAAGYSLKKLFHTPDLQSNEPNSTELSSGIFTNALSIALMPLEVIFENLIIVPDTRAKAYSIGLSSKILFSPTTLALFSLYYYDKILSPMWLLYAFVPAMLLSGAIMLIYKKIGYPYILNIYGIICSILIGYFILDLAVKITQNLADIFDIDLDKISYLLIIPLLFLPSLCIQKSFISNGFYRRTLYSILYYPFLNIFITNIICFSFSRTNEGMDVLTRCTLGGILALLLLTLLGVYKNNGHFNSSNKLLAIYSVLQDYIIVMLYR